MRTANHRALAPLTAQPTAAHFVRVRFKTFEIPPVKDGVVIGCDAPIDATTVLETLKGICPERYSLLPVEDDTIAALLVRDAVLLKIARERVIAFVLERVKPAMASTEVLSLDMEIELLLEESF